MSTKKICFLVHRATPPNGDGNAAYLSAGARALGHKVDIAFIDSIALHNNDLFADVSPLDAELSSAITWNDLHAAKTKLSGFDAVWVLSFGARESFLDKIQLLQLLAQKTRVINTPEALIFMHSKISQSGFGGMQYPESHVSNDADVLWRIMSQGDERWVAKPLAESFGRGVFLLSRADNNARSLLQTLTGSQKHRYCLLQRYVPEVAQGEKRVLLAGGEIVGQYLRRAQGDHRANLHQGGKPEVCELTSEEAAACRAAAIYLLEKGVYFAGLDIAFPWLLEWNVISPGGIGTIEGLGQGNLAQTIVKKVLSAPSQAA